MRRSKKLALGLSGLCLLAYSQLRPENITQYKSKLPATYARTLSLPQEPANPLCGALSNCVYIAPYNECESVIFSAPQYGIFVSSGLKRAQQSSGDWTRHKCLTQDSTLLAYINKEAHVRHEMDVDVKEWQEPRTTRDGTKVLIIEASGARISLVDFMKGAKNSFLELGTGGEKVDNAVLSADGAIAAVLVGKSSMNLLKPYSSKLFIYHTASQQLQLLDYPSWPSDHDIFKPALYISSDGKKVATLKHRFPYLWHDIDHDILSCEHQHLLTRRSVRREQHLSNPVDRGLVQMRFPYSIDVPVDREPIGVTVQVHDLATNSKRQLPISYLGQLIKNSSVLDQL
jgi:hypothetical protein